MESPAKTGLFYYTNMNNQQYMQPSSPCLQNGAGQSYFYYYYFFDYQRD